MVEFGRLKDKEVSRKVIKTLQEANIKAYLEEREDGQVSLMVEKESDINEAQEVLRVALGMPSNRVYEVESEWKNISRVPLTDLNKIFIFISVCLTIGILFLGLHDGIFKALSFKLSWKEPWRIFTPVFMHFSFLHILFNMLWMKDLGSVLEFTKGKAYFLFFCVIVGSLSNLAQGFIVGPNFGGMSGIVYGFVGYTWAKAYLDPAFEFKLPKRDYLILFGFYLLCYTGLIGKIANVAHGVGLGLGIMYALSIKADALKNLKVFAIGFVILVSACLIEYYRFVLHP